MSQQSSKYSIAAGGFRVRRKCHALLMPATFLCFLLDPVTLTPSQTNCWLTHKYMNLSWQNYMVSDEWSSRKSFLYFFHDLRILYYVTIVILLNLREVLRKALS